MLGIFRSDGTYVTSCSIEPYGYLRPYYGTATAPELRKPNLNPTVTETSEDIARLWLGGGS